MENAPSSLRYEYLGSMRFIYRFELAGSMARMYEMKNDDDVAFGIEYRTREIDEPFGEKIKNRRICALILRKMVIDSTTLFFFPTKVLSSSFERLYAKKKVRN